jgi:hypothetical protein
MTLFISTLALLQGVLGWPFRLYYHDDCKVAVRTVYMTLYTDRCHTFTSETGPAFIAFKGSVSDGLDWDKDYGEPAGVEG